jgi:hypothetical protein
MTAAQIAALGLASIAEARSPRGSYNEAVSIAESALTAITHPVARVRVFPLPSAWPRSAQDSIWTRSVSLRVDGMYRIHEIAAEQQLRSDGRVGSLSPQIVRSSARRSPARSRRARPEAVYGFDNRVGSAAASTTGEMEVEKVPSPSSACRRTSPTPIRSTSCGNPPAPMR